MPDHPLVSLRVPDREADGVHVGPGQPGPRLVPAERLDILAWIRGESCTNELLLFATIIDNRMRNPYLGGWRSQEEPGDIVPGFL